MTNCPNCGAPIEHYYNYQCPYCKTFLRNVPKEEKGMRINTDRNDIIIESVKIEKSWFCDGWILTLYCIASPKIKAYFQEETYCTIDMPCQCGYQIEMYHKDIYNLLYGKNEKKHYQDRVYDVFGRFLEYLKAQIPPYILDNPPNVHKIFDAFAHWEMIEGWFC